MTEGALGALTLFVALLTITAVVAAFVRIVPIPLSVALVLAGIFLQILTPPITVDPAIVLVVLLPGLVFEAAIRTELDDLRGSLLGVALLAVPGVVIGALVVTGALVLVGMRADLAFVVGAMVAATDPVAVISAFRRLRAPRPLAGLVEAESLLNDGTAIVLYAVAIRAVGGSTDVTDAGLAFGGVLVASSAIGIGLGLVAGRVVTIVDDYLLELVVTLAVAYGSFLVAERLGLSGIVTAVIAGIALAAIVHRRGHGRALEAGIQPVWESIGYVLTALAFLLTGLAIGLGVLADLLVPILAGIAGTIVARAIVVYGLVGGIVRVAHPAGLSRGLPRSWQHVLFWSGLRGTVAVALALSLPADIPQRGLMQGIVFGIVLFTLLVQGTTIGWLLERLGLREGVDDVVATGERPSEAAGPG